MATALLWLFVINLGIALGAGLYEHTIVVPEWIGLGADGLPRWNAEAARSADTGRRFWVYVTTVPLTLLTLANLATAWRFKGPARRPWLGAAVAALADRAITFGYFIPMMIRPHGCLLLTTPSFAHRHARQCSTRDRSCRSLTRSFTTRC